MPMDTMTARSELIEGLLSRGFKEGPLMQTGWKFNHVEDGFVVWFNSQGRFTTCPTALKASVSLKQRAISSASLTRPRANYEHNDQKEKGTKSASARCRSCRRKYFAS